MAKFEIYATLCNLDTIPGIFKKIRKSLRGKQSAGIKRTMAGLSSKKQHPKKIMNGFTGSR